MKISKNNIWLVFVDFYKEFTSDPNPKSICPLFWKGLIGLALLITSPIYLIWTHISYVYDIYAYDYPKSYRDNIVNSSESGFAIWLRDKLVLLVLFLMPIVGWNNIDNYTFEWYHLFGGPLLIVCMFFTFYFIFDLIPTFFMWLIGVISGRVKSTQEKEPSVFIEGIKAIKNKVCPLVEYTD